MGGGWEVFGGGERWCVCVFIYFKYIHPIRIVFISNVCVCDDFCGEGDVFGNWGKQV